MGSILAARRGTVVTYESQNGVAGKVKLEGFNAAAAIIESIGVGQRVNLQFQTPLKAAVYVYVFGDQMGQVMLRGVVFANTCDASSNGLKEIFDYYSSYKASTRSKPVTVTFGDEALVGFIVALDMQPRDPEYMLIDFQLTMATLPKKAS